VGLVFISCKPSSPEASFSSSVLLEEVELSNSGAPAVEGSSPLAANLASKRHSSWPPVATPSVVLLRSASPALRRVLVALGRMGSLRNESSWLGAASSEGSLLVSLLFPLFFGRVFFKLLPSESSELEERIGRPP